MNKLIARTLIASALCVSASAAQIITYWNFNSVPPDTSASTGTLSPVMGPGVATPVLVGSSDFNTGAGSSDPAASDNTNWRTQNYAAQGTGDRSYGVQFAVDTTGFRNITLEWDQYNSNTANKYWRVLYTTDGTTWIVKDGLTNNLPAVFNNHFATISFTSIPEANNNPNFAVRLVSEFQRSSTGVPTDPDQYVAINPTSVYTASSGGLRLDMVTFSGATLSDNVGILTNPVSQVVAVGQAASFTVVAGGGTSPILYQWRTNGVPLAGATQATYTIASAQFADAMSYDCIVTNAVNSATSEVATLTVRTPENLTWTPTSYDWNTVTANWTNPASSATVAFTPGDNVRFDNSGSAITTVNLAGEISPSSVVVDSDYDYTFTAFTAGKLVNTMTLTKRGAAQLTIETDNAFTGATSIEGGVLQIGTGALAGSLGTGPVTNNAGLVINRTGSIAIPGSLAGTGGLTNVSTGTLTLTGSNTFSGPLVINAGAVALSGPQSQGNITNIIVNASVSPYSKLSVAGGMNLGPGATVRLLGTSISPNLRCTIEATGGTNVLDGNIIMEGNGGIQFYASGGELDIFSSINAPAFVGPGSLILRGAAEGRLYGTLTLSAAVNKTDNGTWTVYSTGNSWPWTTLAVGLLRLGGNNVLPTAVTLQMGQAGSTATFDLAGFNQQIGILTEQADGICTIANSSTTSDSVLTITGNSAYSGTIKDSTLGGTRKVGLTVNGGPLALSGTCTYSGPTTIGAASGLALVNDCNIANSSPIDIGAGGVLDASLRADATLAVGAAQTLKGNGSFNIVGNLATLGTIELKVSKASGVVSNDRITVSTNATTWAGGQVTYGGTLALSLSGEALSNTDAIKLFDAVTYGGGTFTILPSTPGSGRTWDTSTLATDGTLRVLGSAAPAATNITFAVVGGGTELELSWPASSGWTLQGQTNSLSLGISTNWVDVPDSAATNRVFVPITPANGTVFYRLRY